LTGDSPDPYDEIARERPENRRKGSTVVYQRDSRGRLLVDLLTAYKWPLVLTLILVVVTVAVGFWQFSLTIPDWFWGLFWYGALGSLAAVAPAYLLVRWLHSISGVELWDHDPVTDEHRHLRVGSDLWADLVVRTPWGETVRKSKLKKCKINGVSGYECMDFRVREDGTPVAVSTWLGESDSSMLRTYRNALVYSRRRLNRKAERAMMMDANREAIIREAAEKVVYRMIIASEKSGMPGGDEIQPAVREVLDEMGLGDPLAEDDLDRDDDPLPDQSEAGDRDRDDDLDPDGPRALTELGSETDRIATNGSDEL